MAALLKTRKRAPDPRREEGLAEIDRWVAWFRRAHEERLSRPHEFPDRHLVEQERAKIDALATAIAERMRSDYLARRPQP
jgi:hypothetical protein